MDLAEVIVVIGGSNRKGLLKLPFADAYHPGSRRWTALPTLPGYMRSEFATCTLRNDVYISGEGETTAGGPHRTGPSPPALPLCFPSVWEMGEGFLLIT